MRTVLLGVMAIILLNGQSVSAADLVFAHIDGVKQEIVLEMMTTPCNNSGPHLTEGHSIPGHAEYYFEFQPTAAFCGSKNSHQMEIHLPLPHVNDRDLVTIKVSGEAVTYKQAWPQETQDLTVGNAGIGLGSAMDSTLSNR